MDYDVTHESVNHDPFYSLQNLAATKSLYCMMWIMLQSNQLTSANLQQLCDVTVVSRLHLSLDPIYFF